MESGNGPPNQQQQQRYCPTPIMAPPSVATSPPLMSGGSVMNTLHQPTHHPPPSISPHPGAYYGHHAAGTSHYPTPSPTPPPPSMHHQQYYGHAHSYYAHGSHQQPQQQQSQQSQHHAIANTHVPMANAPGAPQPTSQHSHMMGHGSYHHPQSQTHHQQWTAPSHPHQQQSHHYYHQPTHHSPSQVQQQQQQPQQHGYPPPPHSPYSYVQPHVPPSPTPPPPSHTPHPQPQHHQQTSQPQQQQHPPPPQVSVSPGPGQQMHQAPPPPQQQQPQSHALMNLSRFVSQQSPSSPSPRASPSHHPQQMPPQQQQMGPTSPLPYSSHLEHHPGMNGHTPSSTGTTNSPVMSPPPPAPVPNQQSLSPPSGIQVSQQHHYTMPPQSPFNINGGGELERHSPATTCSSAVGSPEKQVEHEQVVAAASGLGSMNVVDSPNKRVPSVFSNMTPSKISSMLNSELKRVNSTTTANNETITLPNNSNSMVNQSNTVHQNDVMSGVSSGSESNYPIHSINTLPNELSMDDIGRSLDMANDLTDSTPGGSIRASCSPPAKPMGSPSSSGNGHQMMPVRLQNMHKGARTKANMKKLMQEQHITTPNGQASEVRNAKEKVPEAAEAVAEPTKKKESAAKEKPSKKKKSQSTVSASSSNDSQLPMSPINMDLDLTADSTVSANSTPRPGYTKSGKKIGRPRKDATSTSSTATLKIKGKKATKPSATKKSKKGKQMESEAPLPTTLDNAEAVPIILESFVAETEINTHDVVQETGKSKSKGKRKSVKSSRKQSTNLSSSDGSNAKELQLPEHVTALDLNATPSLLLSEQIPSAEHVSVNETKPVKRTSKKKGGKKSASKTVDINATNTDSSPDSAILNTIPGSKISNEEAQSVAESITIQPSTPISTAKGKKKGKRLSIISDTLTSRRSKSNSPKKKSTPAAVVTKEMAIPLEGGELPRLRSRSPKQRESPPLRISSPRAAKERSATPAATTPQTSTSSRSRASKEKETGIIVGVATPLSSPSLRQSLNKSPEKDTEKVTGRGRSRQKTLDTSKTETSDVQKDMLSPPPSKRSRQLSKESESSDVQRKGRHKPSANETRLSSDSDRSPSVGKRVSRRKSGSVSGSTENLSSLSFNNHTSSSLSLIPSEGSLEMPSDLSVSTNADTSFQVQQQLPVSISPSLPAPPTKGRKGKKVTKTKKTKGKTNVQAVENVSDELLEVFPDPNIAEVQTTTITGNGDDVPVVPVKAKKTRKAPAKKGKRKGSTNTHLAPVASESIQMESNENSLVQVQKKVPVLKLRNRKGAVKLKKTKELPPPITTAQVLNAPVSAVLSVAKKNVKFKPAGKTRKQTKKGGKKGVGKAEVSEIDSISAEYSQVVENREEIIPDVKSLVDVSDVSPSKRRRSSSSATTSNTQVSAKLNTPNETEVFKKVKLPPASSSISAAVTPKALRRDSRSVSRDYDVSVVLTDIAQTFTASDSSLLGISNSLSRLQSPPSSSTFIPVKPLEAITSSSSADVKVGGIPSSSAATPEKNTKSSSKKRKSQSGTIKAEDELPVTKKAKKGGKKVKNESHDRDAVLEAEIAYVLLDMKEGTTTGKSPSPVKSIASVDLQEQSPKKKAKANSRNRSPRRSIDNSAMDQTSFESMLSVDVEPIPQQPPLTVPKVVKRKTSKARRNSKTKSKTSSLLSLSIGNESINPVIAPQSLPTSPNTGITSVKVAKTAVIPTASSLGISDHVIATKRKSKGEKKTPKKGMLKVVVSSPDITAMPQVPVVAPNPAAVTPTKQPRKRAKKTKDSHNNNTATSDTSKIKNEINPSQECLAENLLFSPIIEPSIKKKRQRKSKATSSETVIATAVEPKPSTSAAALAAQSPSSSSAKLFPYQTLPKPYKKPTVLAKPGSFAQPAKEDDNQKKKQDAPTLRVLGGLTKFYRGGEVEDVDPDPKLPKEKAQLQTDNAVPWICSFCHLGPHAQKLGDLFGPYFANLPSIYGKPSLKRETWMHGDCALWAGRLLLIGSYLRRLEETLTDADKEICTVCGKNGATIGCLRRGCKEGVHYPCAVRKFWKMDDQNFHSYCPQHKS